MATKQGPLTADELMAIWQASVDRDYAAPFLAAGEGQGLEAHTQAQAQLVRVSQAIDTTTQACYLLPHSSQTSPPAAGDALATVQLTFTRGSVVPLGSAPRAAAVPLLAYMDRCVRIAAGQVYVEEQQIAASRNGPVAVLTGRRYVLQQDVVFMPGESGPFTVTAVAEAAGYGYNNPRPGTLTVIDQPGASHYHDRATLAFPVAAAAPPAAPPPYLTPVLTTVNEADTFIPDHVGQQVLFTGGANAGTLARIASYIPAAPPAAGAGVTLEVLCAVESSTVAGTFQAGELLQVKSGAAVVGWGRLVVTRASSAPGRTRFAFDLLSGTLANGNTLLGYNSAATATVDLVLANPNFVAEVAGAAWRVVDWAQDLGIAVTNAASPAGGRLGMLDAIGQERNLPRAANETDAQYRARVAELADVVSPNAIKRAVVRSAGQYPYCFREVGTQSLPGFFYDRAGDGAGDFYDDDAVLFAGAVSSGAFVDPTAAAGFQERVEFRDSAGNKKAWGYLARLPGASLVMIRKGGQGTIVNPVVVAAGDVVVGLSSGAVYGVTSVTANPRPKASRFRVYLDYTDMRAMFMVGLPRVSFGEFGFAWSDKPTGSFFDTRGSFDAGASDFYDGFPSGNGAFYRRVFQAVDKVRVGGTTWYLYPEDGSCP